MKYFYLVRHGEKQIKQGDPSLSPFGKRQAKLTAKYLSQFPVKAIFASPMKRSSQTAAEIGKSFKIPVSLTPILKERVNWGDDPRQSFEEFLAMWKKSSMKRSWQPPVGDSSYQSGKRLESFIDSLDSHPSEHIILVTHGGIITDFLRNLFNDSRLNFHMPGFSSSLDENIKECSITILVKKGAAEKLTLTKLADTSHLREP
jgi:broad specificity phosphatase PhoE